MFFCVWEKKNNNNKKKKQKNKNKQTGIGSEYSRVKHDKMIASRQYTGGDNSFWTISRTDIMSGEDHHWNTHEDPVTPPRSPTKGGYVVVFIILQKYTNYVII